MPACRDCPHDEDRHTHYRAGMDCGGCECGQYRRRFWWHGRARQTVILEPVLEKIDLFDPARLSV